MEIKTGYYYHTIDKEVLCVELNEGNYIYRSNKYDFYWMADFRLLKSSISKGILVGPIRLFGCLYES